MNGQKLFGQIRRCNADPGGIKCACCRRGPYTWWKKTTHRMLRRALKVADKREIQMIDE